MKKIFNIFVMITLCGCGKPDSGDCVKKLTGSYTATVFENGVSSGTIPMLVTETTPYVSDRILFYQEGTDDILEAKINCKGTSLSFEPQAEIQDLAEGKGSFSLAPKTIKFVLETNTSGKTDVMEFVLTQP